MYAACRASRQGRCRRKEEEDEWRFQYRWYILASLPTYLLFIVLFICVDSPCSIIIIMLIVDPSACQSPSMMVDYYLCAMCLSRCYVRLYRASREGCGAPSATSATGSAVMSLQESRKLLSPVDQGGGDCVTVVPGIYARSARKMSHL